MTIARSTAIVHPVVLRFRDMTPADIPSFEAHRNRTCGASDHADKTKATGG